MGRLGVSHWHHHYTNNSPATDNRWEGGERLSAALRQWHFPTDQTPLPPPTLKRVDSKSWITKGKRCHVCRIGIQRATPHCNANELLCLSKMAFCLHHLKCPETTLEGNALWVTAPNQQCKKCICISGNSWFQLMTFSPLKSKPKHVKVALLLPPPYTETLLTVIFLYECPFVQLQSLHVFEPVKKKKEQSLWKIFQFVLLQHWKSQKYFENKKTKVQLFSRKVFCSWVCLSVFVRV